MKVEKLINLLYQLKMADLNMTEIFKGQTSINLTRYVLLLFLHRHGKMTQTDIQRELQINGSAISRHLKGLENKGYVTRIRNPDNNREVVVELTDKAKETVGNCGHDPKNQVLVEKFDALFSAEDVKQLSELLAKLTKLEI